MRASFARPHRGRRHRAASLYMQTRRVSRVILLSLFRAPRKKLTANYRRAVRFLFSSCAGYAQAERSEPEARCILRLARIRGVTVTSTAATF